MTVLTQIFSLSFLFHFYPRRFVYHHTSTTDCLCVAQYLGDIIIKEGTIGSKMYFIQEGIVDIVMANGEVRNFLLLLIFAHN
jgi:CRP-like cAMP-binding protein